MFFFLFQVGTCGSKHQSLCCFEIFDGECQILFAGTNEKCLSWKLKWLGEVEKLGSKAFKIGSLAKRDNLTENQVRKSAKLNQKV